jgi:hypothetical protein
MGEGSPPVLVTFIYLREQKKYFKNSDCAISLKEIIPPLVLVVKERF